MSSFENGLATAPSPTTRSSSSTSWEKKTAPPHTKTLRWVNDKRGAKKSRCARERRDSESNLSIASSEVSSANVADVSEEPTSIDTEPDYTPSALECFGEFSLITAPTELLSAQERVLFQHFSERVAPVMVVLDSVSNGYRHIILPLACQDQVLGRAVSVVAAFHLAQQAPDLAPIAEAGHRAVVEKLRRDSLELEPNQLFNPYTLATILVLLVGDTITGASNYRYLLEMLACLMRLPESVYMLPGSVRAFFMQQVKMFQLFGLPLSDVDKGLQIMSTAPEHYLEFMDYPEIAPTSEQFMNLQLMRSAICDACEIYRNCADPSSFSPAVSVDVIERLRHKVIGLDSFSKGAHALVWTYYIAAAESVSPEHREFFTERLGSLYQYTRFGSIPAALQALQTIWNRRKARKWIEIIMDDAPILVM
ncbi:uncharacterized protein E0L32_001627 [Thyridium curvatum]|uniref:Uncharacterized protein n=1 Tax=Thyridium curvatum TaxID=1093900 RepID=A0A507AP80_9PEZI|nr:uncharacterized protein E0L32_001570 [Thyridium curvatum]XP_030990878.1 uncharacterized protein E0L32_001627 [Thyridium curvatum]TPX09110.1 hypothetical protein E0L32_001570 [Thyridium curvatum]TPX09167.1 hypothetical protein E0L32_001627 [Thyridium curvatum]